MTSLPPTQARANLSSLLTRAAKAEDIGILHGDQVTALRTVTVQPNDYALQENGVAENELDPFVKRTSKKTGRDRKAGAIERYSGDLEGAKLNRKDNAPQNELRPLRRAEKYSSCCCKGK